MHLGYDEFRICTAKRERDGANALDSYGPIGLHARRG